MPSRNIIKEYGEGEYYHSYNRGVAKMDIFCDDQDYEVMLHLLKRYLSPEPQRDKYRALLPSYSDNVELIAYCLMPNHYHFLLYLKKKDGIEKLMRSVMTAYSRYFNEKYNRVGTLFQNHFLASRVTSNEYLWHVSRYIHLNPLDIRKVPSTYTYSSYPYFAGKMHANWLHPERLIGSHSDKRRYVQSLEEGREYHELQAAIKHQLAHE